MMAQRRTAREAVTIGSSVSAHHSRHLRNRSNNPRISQIQLPHSCTFNRIQRHHPPQPMKKLSQSRRPQQCLHGTRKPPTPDDGQQPNFRKRPIDHDFPEDPPYTPPTKHVQDHQDAMPPAKRLKSDPQLANHLPDASAPTILPANEHNECSSTWHEEIEPSRSLSNRNGQDNKQWQWGPHLSAQDAAWYWTNVFCPTTEQ